MDRTCGHEGAASMSEETLFERAIQLSAGERAAFLDRECAGQPEFRGRVEALLAADAASHSPLDHAVVAPERTGEYTPAPEESQSASPLSYAENSPIAGDATREADAREPPSSTRSGRSPAMSALDTQQRNAARRGARGPCPPSTVTGHGREWRPARFRLPETTAERDPSAADWRQTMRGCASRPVSDVASPACWRNA